MTARTFTFTVAPAPTGGPAWTQSLTPNTFTTIGPNLTTMQLPSPVTKSITGIFANCGGTPIAPRMGNYGSILVYGGGHLDYWFNECYAFDLETRTWSLLFQPFTAFVTGDARFAASAPTQVGFHSDEVYGEWYNSAGGSLSGQPVANHTYDRAIWLPPGTFGNDPKGYYCIPTLSSTYAWPHYYLPAGTVRWMHYIPLSNPQWVRGPQIADPGFGTTHHTYGTSIYDSLRNRLIYTPTSTSGTTTKVVWYDFDAPSSTGVVTTAAYNAFLGAGFYDNVEDYYLVCTCALNQGFRIQILKPSADGSTITVSKPPMLNAPAAAGAGNADTGGFEWIQSLNRLVFWQGTGSTFLWAQKPANPLTDTWVWNTATMQNAAITESQAHTSRFMYMENWGGVFIWLSGPNGQQAIKVTGF